MRAVLRRRWVPGFEHRGPGLSPDPGGGRRPDCYRDNFEIARRPGAFQIGRNGSPVGFEGHRKVQDMWPLVASIVTFAVSMSISPGPNNLLVTASGANLDRKSVVEGKDVAVRVELCGSRIIQKKKKRT